MTITSYVRTLVVFYGTIVIASLFVARFRMRMMFVMAAGHVFRVLFVIGAFILVAMTTAYVLVWGIL